MNAEKQVVAICCEDLKQKVAKYKLESERQKDESRQLQYTITWRSADW